MTHAEAVQLIFQAGMSTAKHLTDISGRGVGMDIVRANVEKINGSVEVSTRRGGGTTCLSLRYPSNRLSVRSVATR